MEDFDYALPEALIAQEPATPRDASRLLVLPRDGRPPVHRAFRDLPELLEPGDCLVLNDSRVAPARLVGRRAGGGRAEALLVQPLGGGAWRALVRPAARLGPGRRIDCGAGPDGRPLLSLTVRERLDGGEAVVTLAPASGADAATDAAAPAAAPAAPAVPAPAPASAAAPAAADVAALLRRLGRLPLPPYIRRDPADPERYQTVYAREEGSVAAPTAGLHFTEGLLAALAARGVTAAFVTLHVGPGTFRPVRAERVEDHRLHAEPYRVPPEAAAAIAAARARGGRVIAVGTTVARTLEAAALASGGTVAPGSGPAPVPAGSGRTDLFIRPGFRFRVVDGLVTNFHLPRSTLLMLVCAFAGRERVLAAYAEAVRLGYRFYSFGDAMLIL